MTIIESLIDFIRSDKITHTIITKSGNEIRCYDSVELYEGETKIIIAKSQIGLKNRLVTILDDDIEYITETYNDETWNSLLNIPRAETVKTEINENILYG